MTWLLHLSVPTHSDDKLKDKTFKQKYRGTDIFEKSPPSNICYHNFLETCSYLSSVG